MEPPRALVSCFLGLPYSNELLRVRRLESLCEWRRVAHRGCVRLREHDGHIEVTKAKTAIPAEKNLADALEDDGEGDMDEVDAGLLKALSRLDELEVTSTRDEVLSDMLRSPGLDDPWELIDDEFENESTMRRRGKDEVDDWVEDVEIETLGPQLDVRQRKRTRDPKPAQTRPRRAEKPRFEEFGKRKELFPAQPEERDRHRGKRQFEEFAKRKELSPAELEERDRLRTKAIAVLDVPYSPGMASEVIREAFLIMERPGYHPSRLMYNLALKHLGKEKDFSRCFLLFERMKMNRVKPDCYTFASLFHVCAVSRDVDKVLDLDDEMDKRGVLHNEVTLNAMLKAFKEADRLDLMEETFHRMQQTAGVQPDVRTFNILMEGYAKNSQPQKAVSVFELIPEPDLYNYCALLHALGHAGEIDEAINFLKNMGSRGVVPSTACYNTVLQAIAKTKDSQKAVEFYVHMLTAGESRPNGVTFNTLVDMFAKSGDLVNAMDVVRTMKEEKIEIDQFTYTSLLNACAEAKAPDLAETIFYQLREIGAPLDAYAASAFIKALVRSGQRRKAEKFLETSEMKSVRMLNIIIDSYAKEGRMGKVLRLYDDLQRVGLRPDKVTYSSILFCCTAARDGLTAKRFMEEIFDAGMRPSLHVLMSAIFAYLVDRRIDRHREGAVVLDHMLKRGLVDEGLAEALKRIWFDDGKFADGRQRVLAYLDGGA